MAGSNRGKLFFLTVPLLGAAWTCALFMHGPADILIAPLALCLISFSLLLLWRAPPRFSSALISFCAWWLYLLMACLWSSAPFVSGLFLVLFAGAPALWLVLKADGRAANLHFAAMLTGLAALALATVGQFLFFDRIAGPRIHAPFLDPNNLAAAMNFGLLPALALLLAAPRERDVHYGALLSLFAAGLAATQSRGGILAAIVIAVTLLVFAARAGLLTRRKGALAAAGLVLAPLLLQIYGHLVYGHGTSSHLASRAAVNVTDRLALWSATVRMVGAHPWGGVGLGTFSYWYPRFRLPVDHSDGYFAHNDLLQLWAEAGVLAPLLLCIALVSFFRRAAAGGRGPAPDMREIGAAAAAAAFFLQSMVTYELYLPALLIPLGIMLARGDNPPAAGAPRHPALWRAGLLIAALFAAQWTVRAAIGIHAIARAAPAEAAGDPVAMGRALATARWLAPAADFALPQYAARRDVLLLAGRPADGAAIFADGMQQIGEAATLNTGFAYFGVTRARLLVAAQDDGLIADGQSQATAILTQVLRNDPLCLEARYLLAALEQRNGDNRAALDVMGEGLNWPRPIGEQEIIFRHRVAQLCRINGDEACAAALEAQDVP